MFYIFTLFSVFINNKSLYQSFGFFNEYPIIIGFILFTDALAPLDTVVKLLMNILSRKFEFEAGKYSAPSSKHPVLTDSPSDAFAVRLGYSTELARSLIKLQVQNLSTMDADWLYASYHFSHPILTERLGALGWRGASKAKDQESEKVIIAGNREL
jgi:STE24 endopeptidase